MRYVFIFLLGGEHYSNIISIVLTLLASLPDPNPNPHFVGWFNFYLLTLCCTTSDMKIYI